MKCVTWNLEWAASKSKRLKLMSEQISRMDPDVVCYTEANCSSIQDGHIIEAHSDYGYKAPEDRRKVILWSKSEWTGVESDSNSKLPSGRFISGITRGIRFVGVCIPWRDAHVRTGRKDRKAWEDHLAYCEGLKQILKCYAMDDIPVCVLGDYNQRIPRSRQPIYVAQALIEAFPAEFTISTEGIKDTDGLPLIDHIALSPSLQAENLKVLPRFSDDGIRLSDHVGVCVRLNING